MNARWYDSSIGRFISADTIVPDPTNPQSFNRFSYGYNNPVKYADPSGHIPCDSSNLPGMDQGACAHDTQQVIDNNDSYYPQASRVANAIIGAGFGDALPAEYAHYDNSATWNSYFRNAAGLISEPFDWFLTGKEIIFGDVGLIEGAGMVLFAALPVAQGGWGDEAADVASDGVKLLTARSWRNAEELLGDYLGLPKNTTRYKVDGMSTYRIPDFMGDGFIADSKYYGASSLNRNSQLEDFATLAVSQDVPLYIYVREGTHVSQPARELIQSTGGDVIRVFEGP